MQAHVNKEHQTSLTCCRMRACAAIKMFWISQLLFVFSYPLECILAHAFMLLSLAKPLYDL